MARQLPPQGQRLAPLKSIRAARSDGAPMHIANARHPDVVAAQRKERARIRNAKDIRSGGRPR
ncbi:hypothetical protein GCM10010234_24160 [Streptomyces hawaiiensis]